MVRFDDGVTIDLNSPNFNLKNEMFHSPDSITLEIYEDLFCFFGSLSPNGTLLYLRGKVFEEAELEPELLVGQRFTETVFWQSAEYIPDIVQKAIEESVSGRKAKILTEFRVSAKKTISVEVSFFPLLNDQREVGEISFFAVNVDVREKEIFFHKQRSEQLLYAAESAEIGLWFWDLVEDRIISTPKCNELYEIPPYEAITFETFLATLHPEDAQRVIGELRNSQFTGKEYNIEYRVIHADGSIHRIKARGKSFYDKEQNPISMMGMVREVTAIKSDTEVELNRILERERTALDEAEEANRAKDYFMAFISHELRSPLNSILGWSKILLTKQVDEATQRNALETIERGAKAQAKLIEDLVDSARITSGKLRLDLRPINLYNIVNAAYNLQKPAAETKHINLTFDSEPVNAEVFADPMRLQQVFTNLLSNAIKFTPENGLISINVESSSAQVKVTVEDSGQGINPEILPRIFQKFVQADKTVTREKTGLGLGLTIVKTLVEKQGGTVWAESEGLGKGAKFIVSLPIHISNSKNLPDDEQAGSAPEKHGGRPLKGVTILVVEDDFDSREVLKLFLEQSGAKVLTMQSAVEALKILNQNNGFEPDLIISDIAMPVEDGYSFIKKVRELANEKVRRVPALALSAFASVENKEKAFSAGFQKYHTKPFEPDLLVEELSKLVKNDRQR